MIILITLNKQGCSTQQNGRTGVFINILHFFFTDVLVNFHGFAGSNLIENVVQMENRTSTEEQRIEGCSDKLTRYFTGTFVIVYLLVYFNLKKFFFLIFRGMVSLSSSCYPEFTL